MPALASLQPRALCPGDRDGGRVRTARRECSHRARHMGRLAGCSACGQDASNARRALRSSVRSPGEARNTRSSLTSDATPTPSPHRSTARPSCQYGTPTCAVSRRDVRTRLRRSAAWQNSWLRWGHPCLGGTGRKVESPTSRPRRVNLGARTRRPQFPSTQSTRQAGHHDSRAHRHVRTLGRHVRVVVAFQEV